MGLMNFEKNIEAIYATKFNFDFDGVLDKLFEWECVHLRINKY